MKCCLKLIRNSHTCYNVNTLGKGKTWSLLRSNDSRVREGGKTGGIELQMLVTVGSVTKKGKLKPSAAGNTLVSAYLLNRVERLQGPCYRVGSSHGTLRPSDGWNRSPHHCSVACGWTRRRALGWELPGMACSFQRSLSCSCHRAATGHIPQSGILPKWPLCPAEQGLCHNSNA